MQTVFVEPNFLPDVAVAIVTIAASDGGNKAANQSQHARFAADIAAGKKIEIVKNELGKPIAANSSLHISLSHSKWWGAAAVSETKLVGIDIETLEERIERIAHKFLQPDELAAIADKRIETLTLYWSAKESLYKLYSEKQLDFASQLLIAPFEVKAEGMLNATIRLQHASIASLQLRYKFFENHVLTLVSADPGVFNL